MAHKNRARAQTQESGPKSPFVIVLIIAAVVGLAAVGYAITSRVSQADVAIAPVEVAGLENPATLIQMAQGITIGNPDAPITIMEFADYACPACKNFKDVVMPRINLNYIQTGIAKVVFHDFPLDMHPHAFLAARAARCAGDQQRYLEYHDLLFANQASWSTRPSSPVGMLEDYAQQLGLDEDAFEGCLRSDKYADVVTANRRMAEQLNMNSTPSIAVRGPAQPLPTYPDPDFESITRAVEAARGGS